MGSSYLAFMCCAWDVQIHIQPDIDFQIQIKTENVLTCGFNMFRIRIYLSWIPNRYLPIIACVINTLLRMISPRTCSWYGQQYLYTIYHLPQVLLLHSMSRCRAVIPQSLLILKFVLSMLHPLLVYEV